MISISTLRWGNYTVLSRWALNAVTEEAGGDGGGEGNVFLEAENRVIWPQSNKNVGVHKKLEEARN